MPDLPPYRVYLCELNYLQVTTPDAALSYVSLQDCSRAVMLCYLMALPPCRLLAGLMHTAI